MYGIICFLKSDATFAMKFMPYNSNIRQYASSSVGNRVVLGLKHLAKSQETSAQIPAWLLQTHYTMKFRVAIFCHYISSVGGES